MAAINVSIHLFAIFILIALVLKLIETQRQRDLLRNLLQQNKNRKIQVDWPDKFLRHLCSSLAIPLIGKASSLRPHPINLGKIAEFLRQNKIISMQIQAEGKTQCLHIQIKEDKKKMPIAAPLLSDAIGIPTKVMTKN